MRARGIRWSTVAAGSAVVLVLMASDVGAVPACSTLPGAIGITDTVVAEGFESLGSVRAVDVSRSFVGPTSSPGFVGAPGVVVASTELLARKTRQFIFTRADGEEHGCYPLERDKEAGLTYLRCDGLEAPPLRATTQTVEVATPVFVPGSSANLIASQEGTEWLIQGQELEGQAVLDSQGRLIGSVTGGTESKVSVTGEVLECPTVLFDDSTAPLARAASLQDAPATWNERMYRFFGVRAAIAIGACVAVALLVSTRRRDGVVTRLVVSVAIGLSVAVVLSGVEWISYSNSLA